MDIERHQQYVHQPKKRIVVSGASGLLTFIVYFYNQVDIQLFD